MTDQKLSTTTIENKEPKIDVEKLKEANKTLQLQIAELTRRLQIEISLNNQLRVYTSELPGTIFGKILTIKNDTSINNTDKIGDIAVLRLNEMEKLRQQVEDNKEKPLTKEQELNRKLQIEIALNKELRTYATELPGIIFNRIMTVKSEIAISAVDKIGDIAITRVNEIEKLRQQLEDVLKELKEKDTKEPAKK